MNGARIAILAVVVLVVVVAAGEIALNTRGSHGVLSTSDVERAFAAERLDVATIRFDDDGTVLAPRDASFTVVVFPSAGAAERGFEAYADDTDPATFERREENVIVVADAANGDEPLADDVRVRLERALDSLAGQS